MFSRAKFSFGVGCDVLRSVEPAHHRRVLGHGQVERVERAEPLRDGTARSAAASSALLRTFCDRRREVPVPEERHLLRERVRRPAAMRCSHHSARCLRLVAGWPSAWLPCARRGRRPCRMAAISSNVGAGVAATPASAAELDVTRAVTVAAYPCFSAASSSAAGGTEARAPVEVGQVAAQGVRHGFDGRSAMYELCKVAVRTLADLVPGSSVCLARRAESIARRRGRPTV